MAKRGWTTRIPIWVRAPAIIALVLVGVLVSAMLLNVARDGGGQRPSGDQTQLHGGGHVGGDAGHGTGTHRSGQP